jgi:hypothetical protein
MLDFVAFILIPVNFSYFSVCFFKASVSSKSDHLLKLSLTFSTVPACISFFPKAFESLQLATPLQLMYFISSGCVFVAAGKFLVQYPWKTPAVQADVRQSS